MQAKAVQKFKRLIEPTSPVRMESILGKDVESHFVQPPLSIEEPEDTESTDDKGVNKSTPRKSPMRPNVQDSGTNSPSTQEGGYSDAPASFQKDNAPPSRTRGEPVQLETAIAADAGRSHTQSPGADTPSKQSLSEGTRGHARDPLMEEYSYLFIGPSTFSGHFEHHHVENLQHSETPLLPGDESDSNEAGDGIPIASASSDTGPVPIVSESPGAADIDIYETAYQEEIDRIKSRSDELRAPAPTLYLTRRIDGRPSGLTSLLRKSTRETYLSSKEPVPLSAEAADDDTTLGQNTTAPLSPGDKFVWAARAAAGLSPASMTTKPESSQADVAGSRADTTSHAALPSMAAVTSASTTVLPTTTTATVTAAMAPSSADKSRSGLRSLLDKVRQGR